MPAPPAQVLQSAVSAEADGLSLAASGYPAVLIQVTGITTATITFEASAGDPGDTPTWVAVEAYNLNDGTKATTTSANGLFVVPGGGLVRARISAWTAGATTVRGYGLPSSPVAFGDSDIATIAAGETHLGKVGGALVRVNEAVTRPADATAYIADDCIADATSGAVSWQWSVARVDAGSGYIVGAVFTSPVSTDTQVIEVDLYAEDVAVKNQDNAECKQFVADDAKFLGTLTFEALSLATANSTVAQATLGMTGAIRIPFVCGAGSKIIYGQVRTSAFTPASGTVYECTLIVDQN